jgi:hypothetical protein
MFDLVVVGPYVGDTMMIQCKASGKDAKPARMSEVDREKLARFAEHYSCATAWVTKVPGKQEVKGCIYNGYGGQWHVWDWSEFPPLQGQPMTKDSQNES